MQFIFAAAFLSLPLLIQASNHLNSDEGVILEGAWRIINGDRIYSDFFEFIPPGSFYAVAWLWKLIGPSYWSAKLLACFSLLASGFGIYRVSLNLGAGRGAIFFPFLYLISSLAWPIINHNEFCLPFIIWSVFFFLKALDRRANGYMAASGFLAGLSALFLQHRAAVLASAVVLFLIFLSISRKTSAPIKSAAVFILAALLPLASILFFWPANLLFQNLIMFPFFHYKETNRIELYLFLFFFLLFIGFFCQLKKNFTAKIEALFLMQIALFISILSRPDYSHITSIFFPTLAIAPLAAANIHSDRYKKILQNTGFFLLMISLVVPPMLSVIFLPPFYTIHKYRKGLFDYVDKNCRSSEYIYSGPFIPGMYFETRLKNPTPFSFLIERQHTDAQFTQAARLITEKKPACVIMNYAIVKKFNYQKNNPVDNLLSQCYSLTYQNGNYDVFQLKP